MSNLFVETNKLPTDDIAKVKEACANVGQGVIGQFIEVNKMITTGKGAQREMYDIIPFVLKQVWYELRIYSNGMD